LHLEFLLHNSLHLTLPVITFQFIYSSAAVALLSHAQIGSMPMKFASTLFVPIRILKHGILAYFKVLAWNLP